MLREYAGECLSVFSGMFTLTTNGGNCVVKNQVEAMLLTIDIGCIAATLANDMPIEINVAVLTGIVEKNW